MIEERRYLHRAQYVLPVRVHASLPKVLVDGAVLTEDGMISTIGTYVDLQESDAALVDHGKAVLMPGMVNCHSHLELSYYSALSRADDTEYDGDMTLWIRKLLSKREHPVDQEDLHMASWQTLARMYAGGCRGLSDIGNFPESSGLGSNFKVDVSFFREVLGLSSDRIEEVKGLLRSLPDTDQLAVHSPYSTHPEIIRLIKERASRLGHILPIHVAESSGEVDLLATGEGVFRDFLEERGVWDGKFNIPGKSPVTYLDDLGVLDENTLCVHCVHVTDDDIEIMAERNAAICVCPGSNRFLGVGKAPLDKFLANTIRVVIGTDSLASNPEISMWEEMRLLSEGTPDTDPFDIMQMATINGASLLGLEGNIGSLQPGCSSSFLAVTGDIPDDADEVCAWLVSAGLKAETEWVE